LVESARDGGVFIADIFEFNDAQRQAIDEDKNVRAPIVAIFNDGELVDGGPVVVVGIIEVNELDLIVGDGAVFSLVFGGYAFNQHLVKAAVVLNQAGGFRMQYA